MRRVAVVGVLALVVAACSGDEPTVATSAASTMPPLSVTTTLPPSTTTSLVAATTSTMPTTSPDTEPTTTTATTTTVPPDVTPPVLAVTDPDPDVTVITRTYIFRGTVERGCHLIAAGRYPVDVDPDGTWAIRLVLRPGGNAAAFKATDPAGNVSEANVRITYASPTFDTSDWIGRTAGTTSSDIDGFEQVVVGGHVRDDLFAQVGGAVAPWDAEYSSGAYAWVVSIVPDGVAEPPAHGRVMVWLVDEPNGGVILDALGLITSPGNELEYCWQVHAGGAAWPLVIWVGGYGWAASPPPEYFSSLDLAQLECSAG